MTKDPIMIAQKYNLELIPKVNYANITNKITFEQKFEEISTIYLDVNIAYVGILLLREYSKDFFFRFA